MAFSMFASFCVIRALTNPGTSTGKLMQLTVSFRQSLSATFSAFAILIFHFFLIFWTYNLLRIYDYPYRIERCWELACYNHG